MRQGPSVTVLVLAARLFRASDLPPTTSCRPCPPRVQRRDEMSGPGIERRNTYHDAGQRAPLAPADPGRSRVGRVRDRRVKSSGDAVREQLGGAHFRQSAERSERKNQCLARCKNTSPRDRTRCGNSVDNICRLNATNSRATVCARRRNERACGIAGFLSQNARIAPISPRTSRPRVEQRPDAGQVLQTRIARTSAAPARFGSRRRR